VELWECGFRQLVELIKGGQASSREVVEAHLERIRAVNPALNALPRVLADHALKAADEADRIMAAGGEIGALPGVPISIKENVDVAGLPTTHGVVALADTIASNDSPQVRNLRMEGAIVIARGNLPEFALRWDTDNELYGATINPWDQTLTPGGSSGGDAVAIATGMVPLGLGNDDGGSLRYPAQCTGIASIKPSFGRVPRATGNTAWELPISNQLLNAEGPMARDVDDLRLALQIMGRASRQDPWHVPVVEGSTARQYPLRVAVVSLEGCSVQVAGGVRKAATLLTNAGYEVEEAEVPSLDESTDAWNKMIIWDTRLGWHQVEPLLSPNGRRQMELTFEIIGDVTAEDYQQSFIRRIQLARQWAEFQDRYRLVLGPVSTQPPFERGTDLTRAGLSSILGSMRLVVAVNLIGLPAAVVPVGIEEGLPQAAQIIGPRFGDELCLDAGAAIQAQVGTLTPISPVGATAAGEC
jgi:amidase